MKVNPSEGSPLDVFSSSFRKKTEPAKKTSIQSPLARSIAGASPKAETASPEKKPGMEKEVIDMLTRIHTMRTDIDSKLEALSRKSGLSKEQIFNIAKERKLFPPQTLEAMEKQAHVFANKVWGIQGKEIPTKGPMPLTAKQRKSKLIGSRRNWLSTR